jgi:hypothetical protein
LRADYAYDGAGAEELAEEDHVRVGRAAAAGAEDVAPRGDPGEVGFADVPDAVADVGAVGGDVEVGFVG